MIKNFIFFTIILISFMMFFLNHPLSMGLLILLQTLLTCLLSGMMIKTYWFSYILFLTFLGGLLVLFIYVSSIASNELFMFPLKMKVSMLLLLMFLLILSFLLMNKMSWMNFFFNPNMNFLTNMLSTFNNENFINLSKLYNKHTFLMMMMMIIYLFITLITVVKITNIFFGPLRPFN